MTWATLESLDVIDPTTNDVMSALSPIGALNGAPAASQSALTSIEPYWYCGDCGKEKKNILFFWLTQPHILRG
jgi:hypothetical protein